MEGILIELAVFAPFGSYLAGLALLAGVAAGILLGYTAEEEKRGRRLHWAEWPSPEEEGTTGTPYTEREYLEAA